MTIDKAVLYLENMKWLKGYSNTTVDGRPLESVIEDIIRLLEVQEPRVLALNEIHRSMAVWLEDVDKPDVILAIGGSSSCNAKCFITEFDKSIAPLDDEYNRRWRAWTKEPTEEQRKAVKWNDR